MNKKGFDITFKNVDTEKGIVQGYFASFGTKDLHGDVIEPGAFKKSIQERGPKGKKLIKYLLDHDTTKQPGLITELYEDSFGLAYEAKVGRHSLGRDFLLMVEDGLINQHSFGYSVVKSTRDSKSDTQYLKELRLFEGSAIQFLGANENTPITGLKSLEDALEMCAKLESFVRSSNATDETLQKLSEQLISLHKSIEPFLDTQKQKEPITKEKLRNELINLF